MVQNHNACFNSDGSLDLYLQPDEPPANTNQKCNWLPTPKGVTPYIAFLRLYWPDQVVLTKGGWIPPKITAN